MIAPSLNSYTGDGAIFYYSIKKAGKNRLYIMDLYGYLISHIATFFVPRCNTSIQSFLTGFFLGHFIFRHQYYNF